MSLILTVLVPTVRIRRGPGDSASIVAGAKAGEQYPVINLVDLAGREQWAKVVVPKREHEDLYICVRMPNGNALCSLTNVPSTPPAANGDYERGWNDALGQIRELLERELRRL